MRINQSIWSRTCIAVLILSFALATTPRANAEDRGNSNRDAAERRSPGFRARRSHRGPDGMYVAAFGFNAAAQSPAWDSFLLQS
jgi:hypothetical protein